MPEAPIVFLRGKKTILRPVAKADIPTITRWINDPVIRQFISSFLPQSEAEEEKWLQGLSERKNTDLVFAIETIDSGRFIGLMGIHAIKWNDRTATTGALIGETDCHGKGYGTDAKLMLLHYAFDTLNLRKICSSAIAYNERSVRYNLRCGYREEGRRAAQYFKNGEYWDDILLACFREWWFPIWERYLESGKHG